MSDSRQSKHAGFNCSARSRHISASLTCTRDHGLADDQALTPPAGRIIIVPPSKQRMRNIPIDSTALPPNAVFFAPLGLLGLAV
jgi:hypothetical protein